MNVLVEKPDGIKYLMRKFPTLNIHIVNDKKIGSGILNTIIKIYNLPFKLHAPWYHFLGPRKELDKRLAEMLELIL